MARPKPKRPGSGAKAKSARKVSRKKSAAPPVDHDGHIDSCDLDFNLGEATADADLPPARGGVEEVRRTARRR